MPDNPHEQWLILRTNRPGDSRSEVATIVTEADTGFGMVRFALSADGAPSLLVPIAPSAADPQLRALSGLGVEVRISRLTLECVTSIYLEVTLRELCLDQLFGDLCGQILSRISAGAPPVVAVKSTIEDFRTLLAETPRSLVESTSLLGLLGELVILREGVKRSTTALEAWTGPMGMRHDFRGLRGALEVKTTGYKQRTTIRVHGLEQLSTPSDAPLWLAHVVLESTKGGSIYVEGLCQELVAMGLHADALRSRLSSIGCEDPSSRDWNSLRASLEELTLYSVAGDFPRLTPSNMPNGSVPPGISDVEYTIDLSSATHHRLSAAQHNEVFEAVFS